MKALGFNLLISTVVIEACFALGGELRHPSSDTLEAMILLSLGAGTLMWLRDVQRDWMFRLAKPKPRDEDQSK
jgi:hypothetical protein